MEHVTRYEYTSNSEIAERFNAVKEQPGKEGFPATTAFDHKPTYNEVVLALDPIRAAVGETVFGKMCADIKQILP
ncbi:MAG TPA: hypothetical protein DHV51_05355 [Opitutae bacterium]|nr:hypothetical protein [Opitutae bacterium]